MTTAGAVDCRKSKPAKLNIRKFTIFVCLSMLCFIAGYIYLKVESGRSVTVDIENEVYQTFERHRQKLDAIGQKYKVELDAVKKNSYSSGNN